MDWIPVTERLPEKDGRYLCTIQNKYAPEVVGVMVCDYWNFVSMHDWCPDDETASDNVIAWAPLPAPYVEPTDEHYPSWYAEHLEQMPSAQPEIIRCKDCKYFLEDGDCFCENIEQYEHEKSVSPDWFCADGERREQCD